MKIGNKNKKKGKKKKTFANDESEHQVQKLDHFVYTVIIFFYH